MKLGIVLGYSGADMSLPFDRVLEAERLGFDSIWTSEAYGSDAVTPAAWVLARTTRIKVGTAIMQMPARTPALTAMTAMTLDALSAGRFVLGIGPSGPQVVEGWHGVAEGAAIVGRELGRTAAASARQLRGLQKWLEVHGIEHWTHYYTDYGVDLQKRFFGYFLKGEKNGWDKQPRV
jgi:alkanesulfonate monooxygenase SsuD/methylene tetrahydromethanopterin reductase-like flavin-dependent oxidoreductase (luciferase family)